MPAGRGGRLRALLPRVLLAPGPEDLRLLGHMLVCKSRPSTPKFLGALTGSFFWLHVLVSMQDLFVSACGILFPDEGSDRDPLRGERGVLATTPPGKWWFRIG